MRKHLIAMALVAAVAAPAHASLFNVNIDTNGYQYSMSFGNAEAAINALNMSALRDAGFNVDSDQASMRIDYRGVDLQASYDLNSPALRFRSDQIGIPEQIFNGATREESMDMLKDWLKGDGLAMVNKLNKALVASSPFDPLAGNPNSLMSKMVDSSFDFANEMNAVGNQGTENTLNLSLSYGQYSIAGKDVETFAVPLSYTLRFDNKVMKGHRLQVRAPVSYTKIDGEGESYTAMLGLAYTVPVPFVKGLELTPAYDYGVMGSEDLYSAAAMRSISLTTRYQFEAFGQGFVLSNSFADLETDSIKYDDIEVNAGLKNRAMTNGVMWVPGGTGNFRVQTFLRDTRYSGDKLYSERTSEVGFSLGHKRASIFGNPVYMGASYMITDKDDLDGFKLNFGASF